ncbi:MAG: Crp/Fnr family transcriptional regulator [Nitrospirota bacterium]|nr:Crp/Fnr family transcriptional regulator [Nitrospirota bacterium]MDH5768010.1 Crp/Fnr family transcriptional regulator [Nitrospirota bacterium]
MKEKSPFFPRLAAHYLQPDNFFESFFNNENNTYGWGPEQTYPSGTEIIKQDTPANAVYLVVRGMVKLTRLERDGNEVIAGLRHRHWLIGAPPVLLNKPYSFTAITLTNCVLRCISREGFLTQVKINELFSQHLLRLLSLEIFSHTMKIVLLGSMSARERLSRFLYEMICKLEQSTTLKKPVELHKPIKLNVPLKYKEIAQLIAITPEHFSRMLKEMEEQGIITRDKGHLIVKNPMRLLQEN